jgi:plasmid stabilization system protein ParE
MSLTVLYTPRSKETLLSVFNFIESKFGARSANAFLTKVDKVIKTISTQPYVFKASLLGNDVRIAFISKQTSLFYQVTDKSIILLFFWDNRQESFF